MERSVQHAAIFSPLKTSTRKFGHYCTVLLIKGHKTTPRSRRVHYRDSLHVADSCGSVTVTKSHVDLYTVLPS